MLLWLKQKGRFSRDFWQNKQQNYSKTWNSCLSREVSSPVFEMENSIFNQELFKTIYLKNIVEFQKEVFETKWHFTTFKYFLSLS